MPLDLTDIYDQNMGTDDVPVNPEGLDLSDIGMPSGRPSYIGGDVSQYDPSKYTSYLNEPLYVDKGNPDLRRGEAQPMLEKFGNAGMQTLGKIGTQLLDMAGGISSLITDWGDNRNYKNGFTEAADQGNAWLDENFPLYRSTQGTFGLTDASWWLQNASGLTASVAGFALGGSGIAKTLGAIGKGLRIGQGAEALLGFATDPIIAKALAQGAEKTLTAGMLAYAEGAMSGRRVFDQVYTAQLAQGKSDEEAKHIAAQSAATTVQLNTIMNTGMNLLGGMNMFFNHEKNAVIETARKVMGQTTNETKKEWIKRLIEMTPNKYARELGTDMGLMGLGKKGLTAGREAVAEGVEELTNQFAERTGIEEGTKGKTYGLVDQLGQLSNYFDRTMDQEGALNFIMGAVAGPIQNTAAAALPWHKVQDGLMQNDKGELLDANNQVVKDVKDAAPKYTYMNAIKKNKSMTNQFFTNIKDRVLEDAKFLERTEEAIKQAILDGKPQEAEELKNDYFNTLNRNSVQLGFADNLKETYRTIAALDNTKVDTDELEQKLSTAESALEAKVQAGEDTTEIQATVAELQSELEKSTGKTAAMKMGFTNSLEDNSYKERALEAIESLTERQEIYDKVHKKFGGDKDVASLEQKHVADVIFERLAILHENKKRIQKLEKELAELDSELVGTDGLDSEVASVQKRQRQAAQEREGVFARAQTLKEEIDAFNAYLNNPTDTTTHAKALKLLQTYGGLTNGEDLDSAVERVIKSLVSIDKSLASKIDELKRRDLESPEFLAWLEQNPGKNYQTYEKQLAEKFVSSQRRQELQETILKFKDKIQIQSEEVDALQDARTLEKLQKNTESYFKKLEKKAKEEAEAMKLKVEEYHKDRAAQEKANENAMKRIRGRYREEMESIQNKLPKLRDKIVKLKNQLENLPFSESYFKNMHDLTEEINQLEEQILNLTDRFEQLKALYDASHPAAAAPYAPPPPPPPPPGAPPPPGSTPARKATPAMDAFEAALRNVPDEFKGRVSEEASKVRHGKVPWSLNSLPELPNGPQLMQLMKEAFIEEGITFQELNETLQAAEAVIGSSLPDVETPTMSEGILPVFGVVANLERVDTTLQDILDGDETWLGAKQLNAATALAAKSTEYQVQKRGDTFFKISSEIVNPNLNLQVILPTGLLPGTRLRLVVDEAYDGTVNDANFNPTKKKSGTKQRQSKFSDFTKDGKVLMVHETDVIKKLRTEKTQELNSAPIKTIKKEIKNVKTKLAKKNTKTGTKKLLALEAKLEIETKKIKDKFEKLINIENLKTEYLKDTTENNFTNVPIKVVTEDGKTVAYLHRYEWVMEKVDGSTEEYRNVVDEIEGIGGNAMAIAQELLAIRRAVVEQYNKGNKDGLSTQVETKGPGQFIHLDNFERASGHIKGSDFQLAFVVNESTLRGTNLTDKINIGKRQWKGWENRLIALLPMANGTFSPTPLIGNKLVSSTNPADLEGEENWETISRAIELHINPIQAEVDAVKAQTGFNLATRDGFRNFIMQYYTHFTPAKDFLESNQQGMILDTIGTVAGKPTIKIFDRGLSTNVVEHSLTLDANGKLDSKSKAALALLLSTRYKSPAFSKGVIKGLNNKDEFKFSTYEKGEWVHKQASDYNRYLLAYLETNVTYAKSKKGSNFSVKYTDSAGNDRTEIIYGVNPIINFSAKQVIEQNVKEDTTLEDGTLGAVPKQEDQVIEFYEVDPFAEEVDSRESLPSVGTSDKPAISLESLETLFTFVPLEERNGYTPQERLDYYRRIGVTNLPEGYNPFKKCK